MRTNVVLVTNAVEAGGAAAVVTNFVPVFFTNVVNVPATNLVDRPGAEAAIEATGSVVNTFAPGIGSVVALALGGIYHGYRRLRNRKVNEALVQGIETARAVLATTPQGQAVDAQFVKWLMEHQKEAGVFAAVSTLVDQVVDNPAARVTAEEIMERVQKAGQQRSAGQTAAVGGASAQARRCGLRWFRKLGAENTGVFERFRKTLFRKASVSVSGACFRSLRKWLYLAVLRKEAEKCGRVGLVSSPAMRTNRI